MSGKDLKHRTGSTIQSDALGWAGLDLSQPHIMGVLNVTPDSFSDGGRFAARDAALYQAERMIADGAAILDIGGESTRPGAQPVSPQQEQDRILPLVEAGLPALISIDTRHAATMRVAASAGAHIWNDVTALSGDPDSFDTALDLGLPVCLMHMQGQPQTMQANPVYGHVVTEVRDQLLAQAKALETAGFASEKICLDVGIGFGKTLAHNMALLASMADFTALPYAHMLGVSRKSYIEKAMVAAGHGPIPRSTSARVFGDGHSCLWGGMPFVQGSRCGGNFASLRGGSTN